MHIIEPHDDCHLDALTCWEKGESITFVPANTSKDRIAQIVDGYSGPAALICWTSGTTGDPKGVVIPWSSVEARIRNFESALSREETALSTTDIPPNHAHGIITARMYPHLLGNKVVPWGSDCPVTCIMSIPPTLIRIASGVALWPRPEHLEKLQTVTGVGTIFTHDSMTHVAKALKAEVKNLYGISEVGTLACNQRLLDGYNVRLENETIWIKADGLAASYLNSSKPIAIKDGWYDSGDFGSIDGRTVRVIKRRSGVEIS